LAAGERLGAGWQVAFAPPEVLTFVRTTRLLGFVYEKMPALRLGRRVSAEPMVRACLK